MDPSLLRNDRSEAMDRSPVDMAWLVLEAANDLRDDATVEACRRVIDASLNGALGPAHRAALFPVRNHQPRPAATAML
jgi:hypothetical protein